MTTTKTKVRSLEDVFRAVEEAGYPLTEREHEIAQRRLARSGKYAGRPDPLAGTETDPVAAVEHIFDERGGPLARSVDGPVSLYELLDVDRPEPAADDLVAENARLKEKLAELEALGPMGVALREQTTAASTGPIQPDSGDPAPSPAQTVGAQERTGSVTPDALDNPPGTAKGKETGR